MKFYRSNPYRLFRSKYKCPEFFQKQQHGGSKNPRQPACLITRDTNTTRHTQVRKTCEMVATNRNDRNKGDIKVMKELWDEKRYGHLELKSQNLRDQASRHGILTRASNVLHLLLQLTIMVLLKNLAKVKIKNFGESEYENIGQLSENANFSLPPSNLDLNTHAIRSLEDGRSNDSTNLESPA